MFQFLCKFSINFQPCQEVTKNFDIDRSLMRFAGDNPTGPTSKASAAPLTCWEFLKWKDVMCHGDWMCEKVKGVG